MPFVPILSYEFFFIVSEILGYRYEGSESSPIYYIFIASIFLLTIVIFLYDLIVKKNKLSMKNLIFILCIMLIFGSFSIEIILNGLTAIMITRFTYYMVWGFTGTLMGIYLSKKDRYKDIIGFLDILLILINIALVRSVTHSLLNNTRVSIGGATYQSGGYVFALGFGINLFYLVYGHKYNRFNFTKATFYKIFNSVFLSVQLYGVITTGARGAMLLVIFYIIFILILSMNSLKNYAKYSLTLLSFGLIIYLSWPLLSEIPMISNSWDRAFAYVGENGINWGGTSGRDIVYKNALETISVKPIKGYGLFNYFNFTSFPHNIFLEVLLQGGVLYFTVFLIILISMFYKLYRIIGNNKLFLIYSVIFSYPFIMLLFSGSYTSNGLFWFAVSFIYSMELEDIKSSKSVIV